MKWTRHLMNQGWASLEVPANWQREDFEGFTVFAEPDDRAAIAFSLAIKAGADLSDFSSAVFRAQEWGPSGEPHIIAPEGAQASASSWSGLMCDFTGTYEGDEEQSIKRVLCASHRDLFAKVTIATSVSYLADYEHMFMRLLRGLHLDPAAVIPL